MAFFFETNKILLPIVSGIWVPKPIKNLLNKRALSSGFEEEEGGGGKLTSAITRFDKNLMNRT